MSTKYTFLLPAFKPDFFEVALRSIKSQTLKDFKVLVSDDCSPHDLKSIYNKVCGDDARFTYRRNEVIWVARVSYRIGISWLICAIRSI